MKKVIMVCLVLTLVLASAVTCFAELSPAGSLVDQVVAEVKDNAGGTIDKTTTQEGNVQLTAKPASGKTFKTWTITGADGSTLVKDTDYQIISGDLNSATIVIKPLRQGVDVKVVATFSSGAGTPVTPPSNGSPQTSDSMALYLVAVVLGCGAVVFGKKALCR